MSSLLFEHYRALLRHRQPEPNCELILQPMEATLLRLLGLGLTSKDVSQHLGLPKQYVQRLTMNLVKKMALPDRAHLAIWAVKTGLVP